MEDEIQKYEVSPNETDENKINLYFSKKSEISDKCDQYYNQMMHHIQKDNEIDNQSIQGTNVVSVAKSSYGFFSKETQNPTSVVSNDNSAEVSKELKQQKDSKQSL